MAVEILMALFNGGTAIDGEGLADLDSGDPLMKDFQAGKFFMLDDFDFDVGLEDTDDDDDDKHAAAPPKAGHGHGSGQLQGQLNKFANATTHNAHRKTSKKRFAMWMRGKRDLASDAYPVDIQPCGFTKQLDKTSPALFDACANSKPFTRAIVVQRKTVGQAGQHSNKALFSHAFLRLEFTGVLLVGLTWDVEENGVKEKGKFVTRGIKVSYAQQAGDTHSKTPGVLQPVKPAEWAYKGD